MKKPNHKGNLSVSINQKLKNIAREKKENVQSVLLRYVLERVLYRLEKSPYHHEFILKGGLLLSVWTGEMHRPTQDLDLLGCGKDGKDGENKIYYLEEVFREICGIQVEPDGLEFKPDQVAGSLIMKNQPDKGVRIKFDAFWGPRTHTPVQIDIGFGDAVMPAPMELQFPTLLEQSPAPCLLAYCPETVIAEKLHIMVDRGVQNSRMKDFYDIWSLCHKFEFKGEEICSAIQATFEGRNKPIPEIRPFALTLEFGQLKQQSWQAFLNTNKLNTNETSFNNVLSKLENFLMPPCSAAARGEVFNKTWRLSGYWE
ncbi:nucleotidyl transferase AbiEii/AbiGii toxin family protein [Laspinema sp. D1]|uniref:Nucleotidyl transferase AbiEii/AbiGii toxin family protein n=1 Tax=Laspinema palackyanum D2a TaxID=2953684 RepID=A0ABT2MW96_9CYAN|nr:nucleotidyl transferase AbiEii/AbiGii toxin family protein [Laspinema sp. D2a]